MSRNMRILASFCIIYYVISCWASYQQLEHQLTLGLIVLFGSGFAGIQVSTGLFLFPSNNVRHILGFLLGLNGALSAVGWIFLGIYQSVILLPFSIGIVLFLYFSCHSPSIRTETNQ